MAGPLDQLQAALADRYAIKRELGRGGMAIVYLAEDRKHGRKVALKVLRRELSASVGAERFLREIAVAARLTHPNVLPLHDSGEADGVLWYTMPFIDGESLRERLSREHQLPVEDALQIATEVADGLGYAHSAGVVHRDIKPENILLSGGHAVIADFGVARAVMEAGRSQLTETGIAVGTPAYMSPEQAAGGEAVDARSDLYSLGCVLYEMLSGEPPFTAPTAQALIAKKLSQPTPRISLVRETVTQGMEEALAKALAKTPADRFATVRHFVNALATARDGMSEGLVAPHGGEHDRRSVRRWMLPAAAAAIVASLVALNVGGMRDLLTGGPATDGGVIRLAVLPFENLSGDPNQEYLTDGLTEELTAELGRLHPQQLDVIGRQSVARYKGSDAPIEQIGHDLSVGYVLAGSAQWDSTRIRIRAELIRVRGQAQVWTEAYEGDLSSVLTLQGDVARRVAGSLALELLPVEAARLASVRSVDPAAYEAYLKGQQYRRTLTEGGLETAERYYRRALEIDPNFAAAWAGISRVWTGRGQMGITPEKEAVRNSKEAILKALTIDETEWEAHRALAGILTWGEWNWPAAERQWNRILAISPSNGETLAAYSHFLMNVGRPEEAMTQVERALELDPLNVKLRSFYVTDLVYVRRYDDAITEAREVLRLQPDAPVARNGLYYALFAKAMFDEALAEDRSKLAGDGELLAALEQGYAEAGYLGAQRRLADLLSGRYGMPGGPSAYGISLRYLYAGDRNRVLQWLERAYQDGDGNMPYLGLPIYDSVRSDPRFQDLMRRVGLPV